MNSGEKHSLILIKIDKLETRLNCQGKADECGMRNGWGICSPSIALYLESIGNNYLTYLEHFRTPVKLWDKQPQQQHDNLKKQNHRIKKNTFQHFELLHLLLLNACNILTQVCWNGVMHEVAAAGNLLELLPWLQLSHYGDQIPLSSSNLTTLIITQGTLHQTVFLMWNMCETVCVKVY